jgi:signal transduction histidine kinase/CheY-like chemotaxis protein
VISEGAWISITASPLKDELGAIWGGVVVFADITERKRVDQALHVAKDDAERANRAKSEFLSRMSHELRTPLNSILGFSQILKMHDLPERPRECVEHVMKGGTHLLGLIDEVLDIARIEAGRLALSPEPVLASDSVHQVLDMVRPLAAARNITLTFDRPRSCQQHILADRQRLHQVLLNLLSNAVKYNHDGGRVDISCNKSPDRQLRLSVRDTGAGISEADQARLFAPFERLAANDSEVQGTGLGLALSKRLMEAMGGKIGLESLPGDGSTFWIELPHAEAPEDAVHRQEQLSMIGIKHIQGTRTVLYIEDNLSNMRLMEHIVSYRPQISLVPAMQGRLGLELAYQHRPDLILLDLHLPDLSGDEVLKRLQADPRTRGIPVVMISADATPGQVNRLLGAGAAAYLTKPLNVENLLKVFDDHLAEFAGTDFVAATNERKS